jgi:hypothetical protein
LKPSTRDGSNIQNVADKNHGDQRHEDVHDVLLTDALNAKFRSSGRSDYRQDWEQVNPP